jgi:Family of unknown function (DUF6059)
MPPDLPPDRLMSPLGWEVVMAGQARSRLRRIGGVLVGWLTSCAVLSPFIIPPPLPPAPPAGPAEPAGPPPGHPERLTADAPSDEERLLWAQLDLSSGRPGLRIRE